MLQSKVMGKSFGIDTAVEEAQRAINAAHVEVESVENGVGIVTHMGRYSGFIAMFATLASRDVRIKENGLFIIVIAEGTGQEYVAQTMHALDERDASGCWSVVNSKG